VRAANNHGRREVKKNPPARQVEIVQAARERDQYWNDNDVREDRRVTPRNG
jgi:hypothetical protein